jgi:hypothetical protein
MRVSAATVFALLLTTLLSQRAEAQGIDATAFGTPVALGGITIDGPPPPEPPATITRDDKGQVTIRAVRITESLRTDGNLEENVYRSIAPMSGFIQTNPRYGEPATEQTEVWIFFDDDNLYVSARCHDSQPEERWVANEMRRDNTGIVRNENFSVILDTFYDRRNGFLFEITPIDGFWDSVVTNERSPGMTEWNPIWQRKSGRFPGGWTAEMAIPFKSLRYKPGATQVWGINIRRTVRWKNEESFIGRMPQNSGSVIFQVSRAATLVGLDVPPGSKNLEIKPYGIASLTTDRRATPALSKKRDGNAGFDLKYGVTQNLTADFTYNTDFAQVEVDEQQVNLTRFNLFFPEKREFYLEGQGLFDFGGGASSAGAGRATAGTVIPLLFFSRRIGFNQNRLIPVDAGGRLTGKVGKFSVGLMDVRTGDEATSHTPATNFLVMRVKRDILRRSSIGALVTDRSKASLGGGSAQSYGLDTSLGFYTNLNINAYLAKTQNPGVTSGDTSYRAGLNYNGDRYGVEVERLTVGANFNPEVGFLTRSDFHRSFASFRFSPRPRSDGRVRKYSYQGDYEYFSDGDGRLESRNGTANFGIEFQNSDRFNVIYDHFYELLVNPFRIAPAVAIPVGGYGFQNMQATMALGNQRKLSGNLSMGRGSFYGGTRTTASYGAGRFEVSPRFSLEPTVSRNWVDLPYGEFTTTLLANRATFTATPLMAFSGLLQYNSTNKSLSSNLRVRWEYTPGSELFVVYTDEHDTLPIGTPDLKNRALVVKINRLLRF